MAGERAAQEQAKKALGITDENLKPSERAKIKKEAKESNEPKGTKEPEEKTTSQVADAEQSLTRNEVFSQKGITEKSSAAIDLPTGTN